MATLPTRPGSIPTRHAGVSRWIDPAALMRIKNLELRAKVIVEGMLSGLHRSPYHGFSVEFSEYRQYSPGDDPRYVDWKLYARTDRHFIKRFEEETNLRCYLLVDRSRSMRYGSATVTKEEYSITLAATMAYFLSKQRDAVGALTFADRVIGYVPARFRPGHFHRLLTELEREAEGESTDLTAPLDRIAQLTKKRGMVVLISDLLAPVDALSQRLGFLRMQGQDVLVVRVLDRAELDLSIEKPMLVQDHETGRKLYIDPDQARTSYRAKFEEHAAQIRLMTRQLGIDLVEMITDQPMDKVLFEFLNARGKLAAQTVQRTSSWQGRAK